MALFTKDDRVQRPETVKTPISSQTWTAEAPKHADSAQARLGKGSRTFDESLHPPVEPD